MKTTLTHLRFALALVMGAFVAQPAGAVSLTNPNQTGYAVTTVAGDCYAVGQRKAQQLGGQLAKATPKTKGGQAVCVVVILIPGDGYGKRPSRQEFVLPLSSGY